MVNPVDKFILGNCAGIDHTVITEKARGGEFKLDLMFLLATVEVGMLPGPASRPCS